MNTVNSHILTDDSHTMIMQSVSIENMEEEVTSKLSAGKVFFIFALFI